VDYTDQPLTGFVLRVSPTGHRSYSVIYGTGPEKTRFTIGSIQRITLAQARDKAREILTHAELGGNRRRTVPRSGGRPPRARSGALGELLRGEGTQARPTLLILDSCAGHGQAAPRSSLFEPAADAYTMGYLLSATSPIGIPRAFATPSP
jgi:Arm domain-containing DNA-binding protein